MRIGIPKEIMRGERRVAATPETAARLVKDGAEVFIETNAGRGSFFEDEKYEAVGVTVVSDVEELYTLADVILKVKEPQFNAQKNLHEIDMMHAGQVLMTFIHPASPANHEMVRMMAKKGVVGLTLDGVPRITRAQPMDALTSMSTCAGYKGILLAANELSRFIPMMSTGVGMVKPINALIVGVGVGGLQALATVKRLGAVAYAADIRGAAVEQAKSLGAKIVDLDVPESLSVGEGGYAKALSGEWLKKEREKLESVLPTMDIVFLSALVPSKVAPVLITEEMVRKMKPGSVIVDISIDQGGNCAITPPGETKVLHGVTVIGIKNIPGMIPESSSWMFAQNVYHLLKYITEDGQISLVRSDEIVRGILTTADGEVVHAGAREAMGL